MFLWRLARGRQFGHTVRRPRGPRAVAATLSILLAMKALLFSCLLLCSGALWAQPADARAPGPGPGHRWEQGEGAPRLTPEERQARREARRQWLDSRQAETGLPMAGIPGPDDRRRLSPEERQRLRRDVHEAGREFYPRDSRRPEGPAGPPPGSARPPRQP